MKAIAQLPQLKALSFAAKSRMHGQFLYEVQSSNLQPLASTLTQVDFSCGRFSLLPNAAAGAQALRVALAEIGKLTALAVLRPGKHHALRHR